jgi:hypothetical protein
MTHVEKLASLREKLVVRRRSLVESLQKAAPEQLTGDSVSRIQSAIDAVNKAIDEERRSDSVQSTQRQAARVP